MRKAKSKRKKMTPAQLQRAKDETIRLVRDLGYTFAAAEREIGVRPSWISYHRKADASYNEAIRKARLEVSPSANWREAFIRLLSRGSSRTEALAAVQAEYPELTPSEVEDTMESDEAFAKALRDIEILEKWEIWDNLKKRAKDKTPEARLVLDKLKRLKPGLPDSDDPVAAPPDIPDDLHWFTMEEEAAVVDTVYDKPFGKKRKEEAELRDLPAPGPY